MTNSAPGVKNHVWTASDILSIVALFVSVIAALVAVIQTQRANDISESALRLSEALAPKPNVFVNPIDALLGKRDDTTELRLEIELVNSGQVHLSGCTTRWQGTDADGQPNRYLATLAEPGGETWDVAPGGKHVQVILIPLISIPAADPNQSSTYVVSWFECQSSGLVTSGLLYGIDTATMRLLPPAGNETTNDSRRPIGEVPPLGWYERAEILSGGSFPYPSPVPSPQFTQRRR